MNTTIIVFIIMIILGLIGLYKIFEKAGVAGWKAFVPILNASEWLRLIGKPQWWIALLFIPIVNVFYLSYMLIGLAKSFKHYNWPHHFASVAGFWAYLPWLGFSKDEKYYGIDGLRKGERHPEKTNVRGWIDAIVFAIFAAYFIRMFLVEAYKIPTASMEPTLQIGDFMFVSKLHYGSRVPNTPAALPLVHHTIPKTKARAYSEIIKWDYYRLPGLQKIKRNDIAVFNAPFEYNMKSPISKGFDPLNVSYKSRPVDKREHYIKRTIGMPGDQLQVKDNQLYINGNPAENPEQMQFKYRGILLKPISREVLREIGIRAYTNYFNGSSNPRIYQDRKTFDINMTPAEAETLKASGYVSELNIIEGSQMGDLYLTKGKGWTFTNYGEVWVPKKGETLTLTNDNFSIYKEFIQEHEGNTIKKSSDGSFVINGETTNQYTFKMDYYFMMGDNRHASSDSRDWGFVPENHIVGKPLFIFWSGQSGEGNTGIRWNRLFKGAQDMN